jgi:uncharacterized protein YicC (UPF0701 family)
VHAFGPEGCSSFLRRKPDDFDPATILNEELAAQTAKQLEIEIRTNTDAYYKKELSRFDTMRETEVASSKAYRAKRVAELEAELEEARAAFQAVDSEFAAKRQEFVDNISENEARLAELTSGS